MSTKLNRERLLLLVRAVASNLGRAEGEGATQLIVFHFLSPFQLEFAQRHVNKAIPFKAEDVNSEEFRLVVEVYRRLASRMPEAFHVDDVAIHPTDFPGRIVGRHDVSKVLEYWSPGRDSRPDPYTVAVDEVVEQDGHQ